MNITDIRRVYAAEGMHCAFTDLFLFRGRYYLGFKEGPKHMVDAENHGLILTSEDGEQWSVACRVHCGKDTREPKFMELNGRLLCYFFTIEPALDGTRMITDSWCMSSEDGMQWSEPVCFAREEKYWHPVSHKGVAYCVTHPKDPAPDRPCRLMCSRDGLQWEHLADVPIDHTQKPNEASLAFDSTDTLHVFIRTDRDQCLAWLLRAAPPYRAFEKISLGERMGGPLVWVDREDTVYLGARFYPCAEYPHTGIFRVDAAGKPQLITVLPSMGDSSYMGVARKKDDSGYLFSYYSSHEALGGDRFEHNRGAIYLVETSDGPAL